MTTVSSAAPTIELPPLNLPPKAQILYYDAPYKALYGGRGSGKSHSVAAYLVTEGVKQKHLILCAREFQKSIRESVLRLLANKIASLGLSKYYTVTKNTIIGANGTAFIFTGLHHNIESVKSMEGLTKIWLEEAQTVSEESWDTLIPTMRDNNGEIIATFNPKNADDPTYVHLVSDPEPGTISAKMNWSDNPYFPKILNEKRLRMKQRDPDKYDWIWRGNPKKISDAIVFKGKFSVEEFETPETATLYFGADFGHAADPSTLIRCWIDSSTQTLYIDQEEVGYNLTLDELPAMYSKIPGSRDWFIRCDSSRPESVAFLRARGFNTLSAEKWPNSVIEGIEFIRSLAKVVIHPRCKHTAKEFSNYSWKVDRVTGDVLPLLKPGFDHLIDALRYALSPLIKMEGTSMDVWALLAD